MAVLYGPDGEPIQARRLKEEQAAPTLTGIRQIVGGHPAQGLTPQRLARLLREAEDGEPTRYLELAEEMEEKDLHYTGVLGTRKRQVSQLEISVEPASDAAQDVANAELVESFLKRDELQDEMFDILDAIGKGFSITEIIWETSERDWRPARLEYRLPQWFVFDRVDGKTPLLRTEAGFEPLAPFKFITYFAKAKSGLPIRGGLARLAAWGYLFKNYAIKDWVAFAEIYGQPLRVGKYHPGATADEKDVLLRAVGQIGTDAAAIIPQSMLIEFVESAQRGASVDLYKGLAEYLDAQISKGVLGQTLTTEVKGGSLAAAKVHQGVSEDIERSDSRQVAAALNHDLVRPLIDLNRGPQKAYPRLRIGRPEQVDVPQVSEALSKLVPLGLKVRQSQVRRFLGLEEPDEGDELLAPPARPELPSAAAERGQDPAPLADTATTRSQPPPRDAVDDITDRLSEAAAPAIDEMVERIRAIVMSADSLPEVAAQLMALYPALTGVELAETMREAMVLAELAGRAEIADG